MSLQKKISIKKTTFKNAMGFKKIENVNISIKLHSFVHYSPRDVHRIADK